jgi:outer membrane lipoprotein SlyB
MKKHIIAGLIGTTIIFTGCIPQKGIGLNVEQSSMKQTFETGKIISQKKVLIDQGSASGIGTGAALGAGAGAILGSRSSGINAVKGGIIGAVVGAGVGAIASNATKSNEVEAFEVEIQSNIDYRIYKTFVEYDLPVGTTVEYIVRPDGTISNIDVKRAGKRVNR